MCRLACILTNLFENNQEKYVKMKIYKNMIKLNIQIVTKNSLKLYIWLFDIYFYLLKYKNYFLDFDGIYKTKNDCKFILILLIWWYFSF